MMNKKSEVTSQEKKSLIINMIVKFGLVFFFIWLLLILPAGTLNYWQVYVYFGILLSIMIIVLPYFLKNDPKFLQRRLQFVEKDKQQKIMQFIVLIFYFAVFPLCALDIRFGWSNVPIYQVIIADVLVLISYILILTVFKQNSYASRIVEVDQHQTVISTGLYSIVRHPMYLGVLIMYMVTPIALGSYWGILPILILPFYLVFRILNEEKLLRKELPEYSEYCQKVRYHLIPFIW